MADDEVPEDVRALLHEHIETYEQLAVLALLVAHPADSWDLERAAASARVPIDSAEVSLGELCQKGFAELKVTNGVRTFAYAATCPMSETIERLAGLYTARPLEIMHLMNANAIERVRTSMARSFANAFVVGRKK